MLLVNTFDVEPWWTTVPPSISNDRWSDMPDRSERPLKLFLDLCDEASVRCTFFFIGWYALRYPERLREVLQRGHEIGCHSLMHEDVATLSLDEFRRTTKEAKDAIEDATGSPVYCYRAPSFSFPPERSVELLREIKSLGFTIDSSITTARRIHGGGYSKIDFPKPANLMKTMGVDLFEIPVPGVNIFGKDMQILGGGYLRLSPPKLLRHIVEREEYQVLYLHPHDFDLSPPRIPNVGIVTNLRRKIQVGDLHKKVLDIFAASNVRSCGQLYAEMNHQNG